MCVDERDEKKSADLHIFRVSFTFPERYTMLGLDPRGVTESDLAQLKHSLRTQRVAPPGWRITTGYLPYLAAPTALICTVAGSCNNLHSCNRRADTHAWHHAVATPRSAVASTAARLMMTAPITASCQLSRSRNRSIHSLVVDWTRWHQDTGRIGLEVDECRKHVSHECAFSVRSVLIAKTTRRIASSA